MGTNPTLELLKKKKKGNALPLPSVSAENPTFQRLSGADTKERQQATKTMTTQTRAALPLPSVGVSDEEKEPKPLQRIGDVVSGALKGYGADIMNILGTMQDIDTKYREAKERMGDKSGMASLGKEGYSVQIGGSKESDERAKEIQASADRLKESSEKDVEKAKQGLGGVGQFAVDLGVAGAQMAGDIALGAATGGGALVPMAARVFGGSAQEARRDGATLGQQLAYGAGSAALSVATEQIANTSKLMQRAFGKSTIASAVAKRFGDKGVTKAITEAVNKMQQTAVGRAAINAISEGGEEFIEDIFRPMLQRATYNKDAEFDLAGAIYDAAVGGALGMIGGVGEKTKAPALLKGSEAQGIVESEANGQSKAEQARLKTFGEDAAARMQKTVSAEETAAESVTRKLRESLPNIRNMESVSKISGNEVPKNGKPTERALEFLKTIGNKVTRKGFGEVLFSKSNVKSGLVGHGISEAKIETIAAVPAVIQNGQQIDFQKNWKGRNWDSYIFAAPVEYKGKTTFLAAVVAKDNTSNRYYLHQVVDENGEVIFETKEAPNTEPDGTSALSGDLDTVSAFGTSEYSMPENGGKVNNENAAKPLMRGDAEINTEANQQEAPRMTEEEFRQAVEGLVAGLKAGNFTQEEYDAAVEFMRKGMKQGAGSAENVIGLGENATANDIIERMPAKAKKEMQKQQNRILRNIGDILSVPVGAQREYLKPVVETIAEEYIREGKIPEQAVNDLFEYAYEKGVMESNDFYEQYKDIKKQLRDTKINITQEMKSGIDQYGDFRRKAMGTLTLVNDGGIGVDIVYEMFSDMAPELFPTSIINPEDQLRRLYEVGSSIAKTERTLDEYYGKDKKEYKRWAKNNFVDAVEDAKIELKNVKRYTEESTKKAERPTQTKTEVEAAYQKLKSSRRDLDKIKSRSLLTDNDKAQLARIIKGEITLDDLDANKVNMRAIREMLPLQREYEAAAKTIGDYKREVKASLFEKVDGFLGNVSQWKDKRTGLQYSRETMERNIRDITPDKETAERISNEFFRPVHSNEAAATRGKNRYRDRVRAMNLSRKVAEGNDVSEAHAVQLLGEAEDNIKILQDGKMKERDGKTLKDWEGVVENLWHNNPNLDQKKIRDGVEEFRKIYDELFEQMNEVRIRWGYEPVSYRKGYFPHFQPGEDGGLLSSFAKALGVDADTTALPTTINGLTHTFRPGITWFGNAQERLGFNTAYDAVEGFDKYIEGAMNVIHHTEDIQKLRALSSRLRYRTSDEGLRKQVDEIQSRKDLDETEKQDKIDKLYENGRFEMSNFVVELDEYTNLLAGKKSRGDREMERKVGRGMYNFAKAWESRVAANMVAVNPASWLTNFIPITQAWASVDSKSLLRGMSDTLKAYKANDGFVDRSTFLTNRRGSDPIVKAWEKSVADTQDGAVKRTVKSINKKTLAVADKLGVGMEYIDNFAADTIVRARYAQNIKRGLSEDLAMAEADQFAANVMADRSKGSMPTMFHETNPLTKLFTQFQLEVNNQLSYVFKDLPDEAKDAGKKALAEALMKFMVGAFLYNEVYEFFIGRRPALDPIGILNDTVGDLTGYELPNLVEAGVNAIKGEENSLKTEKVGLNKAGANLAKNVAEELPFIGGLLGGGRMPISSSFPNAANLWDAATNDAWDTKKRVRTAAKELAAPATYLIPAAGGGQIKKVWEGVRAVRKGGSFSVDSQGRDLLQYPVFNDTAADKLKNTAGAILFGKTSLKTGRDWVESGFKTLGAKETEVYKGLNAAGVSDRDGYALLQELRGVRKTDEMSEAEGKRKMLRDADISEDGKSLVYYTMLASDSEVELMDKLEQTGADMTKVGMMLMNMRDMEDGEEKRAYLRKSGLSGEEMSTIYYDMLATEKETEILNMFKKRNSDMGEVTKVLSEVRDAGQKTGAEAATAKKMAIAYADLSDDEKVTLYRELVSDKNDNAIEEFRDAGLSMGEFLEYEDKTANAKSDASMTKKQKIMSIIDSLDVSDEKKDAIYRLEGYSEKTIYEAPWRDAKQSGGEAKALQKGASASKTSTKLSGPKLQTPKLALGLPRA